MNVVLSWDLFVLAFFVVIIAYSFIIGRDNTLKVILGTYVAILAADAVGALFGQYFAGSEIFLKVLQGAAVNNDQEAVIFVKVMVFIVFLILFAVRGAFYVDTSEEDSSLMRMVLTFLYGVLSAGLIVSAILTFISGVAFIGGGSVETTKTALWDIYNQSEVIRTMVQYTYLWFSIPALAFLLHSLHTHKVEAV